MTHLRLSVSHFARLSGDSVSPQFQVLSPLCRVISQSVFFPFSAVFVSVFLLLLFLPSSGGID